MSSFITTIRSTGHTAPAIVSTIIASGGLLASVTCAVIAVAIFPAAMIPLIIGAAIGLAAAAAGVIAFIYIARASGKPIESQKDFANSNLSNEVKEETQNDDDDFSEDDGSINSEEALSAQDAKESVNEEKQPCDKFNALLEKFRNEDGHSNYFRPEILDSFNELKSSSLDELLTKSDEHGNNETLPMYIMHFGVPDVQMELLNLLKNLDLALLEKILKQQDNDGHNVLMEAMYTGSSDVQMAALELLGGLDDNVCAKILGQQDIGKWNVLMFVLFNGSGKVRIKALELLGKLNDDVRAEILKQQNNRGWNVLMYALCHGKAEVQMAALELLGKLNANDRVEVLKQQSNNKWNVLMYAVRYCSEESAWGKVKECLKGIGDAERREIIDCTMKKADALCSQDNDTLSAEEKVLRQSRLDDLRNMLQSAQRGV